MRKKVLSGVLVLTGFVSGSLGIAWVMTIANARLQYAPHEIVLATRMVIVITVFWSAATLVALIDWGRRVVGLNAEYRFDNSSFLRLGEPKRGSPRGRSLRQNRGNVIVRRRCRCGAGQRFSN